MSHDVKLLHTLPELLSLAFFLFPYFLSCSLGSYFFSSSSPVLLLCANVLYVETAYIASDTYFAL
jgi:hypothetical protein